jgi:hypothetical protein
MQALQGLKATGNQEEVHGAKQQQTWLPPFDSKRGSLMKVPRGGSVKKLWQMCG